MRASLSCVCALAVLTLAACPTDEPIDETSSTLPLDTSTTETTAGDGDPGDGDPGDGDGDPGDGDPGDGDPGDGDGDPNAVCGNGVVEAGEACDDGNQEDTDACTNACEDAACGDGIVQAGVEECDVGGETMFCDADCTYAVCGDGYHNMLSEQCDDGNNANDDGCILACQLAACGDGYVNMGVEACDDANQDDTDDCKTDCTAPTCGDGIVWQDNEECDDANQDDTDACLNNCVAASCGDGVLWAGVETCDDGNLDDSDDCPGSCQPAVCGDGYIFIGSEECDDGNQDPNDFCDACTLTGAEVTCGDIQANFNVWGQAAAGVDLRLFTNSTLHWIGCPGNGCAVDTFYCDYDANAHTLQFGTTSGGAMRSVVDRNNQDGDAIPNQNAGCCSNNAMNGICNSPDSNNNGVNVDMVTALCNALGYGFGTIVREVANNSCPEPHAVDPTGHAWDSDFVSSQGFGAEYLCSQN